MPSASEIQLSSTELWLFIFAGIGAIASVLTVFDILTKLFPALLSVRSRIWKFASDSIRIRSLRRKAIAAGIEQVVNQSAFGLQRELPRGWVRRANVNWVRNSRVAEQHEDRLVLRIRPTSDPDWNFLNAVYTYFLSTLFPDTKEVIPTAHRQAISLSITRSALEKGYEYILDQFDAKHVTNLCGNSQDTLDYYADCVRLNEYGFLTGPFVRELDYMAKNGRYGSRNDLPKHIQDITDHMLGFQLYQNLPEDSWYHTGPSTSYGILLVSRPPEIRPDIGAYVKRAQSHLAKGARRLYVLARHQEKAFALAVIQELTTIRELKLLEHFQLSHDYRGDDSGIGALFGQDEVLASLSLRVRGRSSDQIDTSVPVAVTEAPVLSNIGGEMYDKPSPESFEGIVEKLIVRLSDYQDEWIFLGTLGGEIRKELPSFSPEAHGGANLLSVLKDMERLEFEARGLGPAKAVYVRIIPRYSGGYASHFVIMDESLRNLAVEIVRNGSKKAGWMTVALFGDAMYKKIEGFDYRSYGAKSLTSFLMRIPDLEVEERGEGGSKVVYVRLRPSGA